MATAVRFDTASESLDLARVVRSALILGAVQAVCVLVVSLVNRSLEGFADAALTGAVVAIGAVATIFLPARWLRVRTIDGIGAAAGIGLGAAFTFMLIDVTALQPFGVYTNRWREVGGGSNWWYHPIWWMLGAYLAWMGAWIVANRAERSPSLAGAASMIAGFVAVIGSLATIVHFPGADWNVPTFAVAMLPALALTTLVSGIAARRG